MSVYLFFSLSFFLSFFLSFSHSLDKKFVLICLSVYLCCFLYPFLAHTLFNPFHCFNSSNSTYPFLESFVWITRIKVWSSTRFCQFPVDVDISMWITLSILWLSSTISESCSMTFRQWFAQNIVLSKICFFNGSFFFFFYLEGILLTRQV